MNSDLSHIDEDGAARMVDISEKSVSKRRAVAESFVRCSPDLINAIRENTLAKGDLLGTARVAGILAAKRVDELIPMCHTLALDQATVDLQVREDGVRITASASTTARTGVEMEALTAAAVAALTVIDMGKSIDKRMVIEHVRLLEKSGGRSGTFQADESP